jgi:hypothetical protein
MDRLNLLANAILFAIVAGIGCGLLGCVTLLAPLSLPLVKKEKRHDVGKELDELLTDLHDIEEEEVQIFPWFQEGDKVICIEKSAIDLVEDAIYTVTSIELRNNIMEYVRLAELERTGVSYYAASFALLERDN